ncbi:MAG: hypothetical protein IKT32_00240, partial [Clostridia bacterium]|nr:hypothetical protein [Clostridia bacterium]
MKNFKHLLIVIMVAILTFQATACTNQTVHVAPNGPHMSERVYERVDEAAVDACLSEIYELLKVKDKRFEIVEKREEFFNKYYSHTFTMNTVASINYDKNVNDAYWQEESVIATSIAQKVQNEALKLEQALLTSEYYGDYFKCMFGADYAASILATDTESEEQLAWLNEISTLEAEYSVLYSQSKSSELVDTYIQLVSLRNEYARSKLDKNGEYYKNYMDYAYAEVYGREYTPDEVSDFRNKARTKFASIRNKYYNASSNSNYFKDESISETKLKEFMPEIIKNSIPEMMSSWDYMMERELYDFSQSANKAERSYVTSFSEYDDAYMFINADGKFLSDLSTLIHEFGHYNEHFMSDPNLATGNMSYDLAETHSQAFELITLDAVKNVIFKNSKTQYLYQSYVFNLMINSIWAILSNCIFDSFEYIVYNANPEDLTAQFLHTEFADIWNDYWPST